MGRYAASARSRAWMFLVDLFQVVQRYMGIYLCGRYIDVAEQSLDGAQVGAILHHMSGTTVTQHVR
jgi:hypothetical protein